MYIKIQLDLRFNKNIIDILQVVVSVVVVDVVVLKSIVVDVIVVLTFAVVEGVVALTSAVVFIMFKVVVSE